MSRWQFVHMTYAPRFLPYDVLPIKWTQTHFDKSQTLRDYHFHLNRVYFIFLF